MVEYHRVALCPRAVNLEQRLGVDNLPPLSTKALRASALNLAFRKAVAESEFMQTTYKFRKATDSDNVVLNNVLVCPDIVFIGSSGDNGVGMVVPATGFNFAKPLQAFPHIVRGLKILHTVYGLPASALWVCRETLNVRVDSIASGDYSREVEILLASATSHKLPEPPWPMTTAYDYNTGEIVYRLPSWPCAYCRVHEECKRRLCQDEKESNSRAS